MINQLFVYLSSLEPSNLSNTQKDDLQVHEKMLFQTIQLFQEQILIKTQKQEHLAFSCIICQTSLNNPIVCLECKFLFCKDCILLNKTNKNLNKYYFQYLNKTKIKFDQSFDACQENLKNSPKYCQQISNNYLEQNINNNDNNLSNQSESQNNILCQDTYNFYDKEYSKILCCPIEQQYKQVKNNLQCITMEQIEIIIQKLNQQYSESHKNSKISTNSKIEDSFQITVNKNFFTEYQPNSIKTQNQLQEQSKEINNNINLSFVQKGELIQNQQHSSINQNENFISNNRNSSAESLDDQNMNQLSNQNIELNNQSMNVEQNNDKNNNINHINTNLENSYNNNNLQLIDAIKTKFQDISTFQLGQQ
ncbi:Zinc finger, FYVE/PHD-type [Pseudocohnilembus persalinus]|uniref:Zinc finger, FYVE/PHD-type n=1 Tax=Pseudocohnilembus persalinus TaxID=266149 RepID=A0A0V0QH49_PSEPJ|nr:Zinc finger, FYVE/PHD-type [Pseudocohnilembus persalinus]|eukprot:KRX01554.1 Zinc finger, FYVE/PHD-type [Pseudocohnilembus persalinus]